jgi:hypothetical protein
MTIFPILRPGIAGFGADGTLSGGGAGTWALSRRADNITIATNDAPAGWIIENEGGRLKITPPAANKGGWYRVASRLGAGGAGLSSAFRVMADNEYEDQANNPVFGKGTTQSLTVFEGSFFAGSGWRIYQSDTGTNLSGLFAAADYSANGWSVSDPGPTTTYPRTITVTSPSSAIDGEAYSVMLSAARGSFGPVEIEVPVVETPPSEQHGEGVEIRLYDKNGKRRRLPSFQLTDASWTIEPSGGYGDFSVTIAARPDELTNIAAGDQIEIYKFAARQYRGYVGDIVRVEDEQATLTLSGYGRILDLERMVLDAVYQRPQAVDLSDLFAEIAADVQTRYPKIAIETAVIGVNLSTLDCRNKTAREALSDLCNTAPSVAHFGFDADEYGRDRLYLRKIDLSSADTTIPIPGRNVGHREIVQAVSDVVNVVVVEGGTPSYPQLLPNGSFEILSKFSDDSGGSGNLLLNPSFEISTSQNSTANWTFTGGASAKKNGGQEASAYAGEWVVELDQNAEMISQTQTSPLIPLVSGHDYTFGIWSRPENNAVLTNPSTAPVATARLFWRDGSGTFTSAGTFAVKAEVSAYRQYEGTFRAPAGTTGFRVEIEKTSGSTGAGKGMLLDSAYLFDNSSLIASGWGIKPTARRRFRL